MLSCSFCGAKADQVAALVAGPDVSICDGCIEIGVRVIATRDALEQRDPSPADWERTDDEALLSQMASTSKLVDQTRDRLQDQVQELRRRGVAWAAIAVSLGVSRQIALERFA